MEIKGAIRITVQEHAIVLVYHTRAWGGDWQDQKEVMVCLPPMREGVQDTLRQWSLSVSALLGHWLSLAARDPLEPSNKPDAQAASPARWLSQPDRTLSAAAAIHAPPYVSQVTARYMALSGQNTVELEGFVSRLKRRIGAGIQ